MSGLRFVSSRASAPSVSLSQAIAQGLATDGGLYVPSELPRIDATHFSARSSLSDLACDALAGFFEGDGLAASLREIADAALNVEAPTTRVGGCTDPLYALELFHGPTAAFKDFGARFLAESQQRLQTSGSTEPLTILVATSGDTGGAVAAAFHRRRWARVVVLYPRGLVSPRQERQLTCWGDNVLSLRVDGTFDDCQELVKIAFNDPVLSRKHRFSSANSINIGRLLPQMLYYMASSLGIAAVSGAKPSYIIPAGNLGNACAAAWARSMGFPLDRIILAHNINRTVPEYLATGRWQPRASVATLASAMDVGNPSNMERFRSLYPTLDGMREHVSADTVDDATIRARIRGDFMQYGREWCPHTATAAEVYARLSKTERKRPWVIVATAHPAKFNEIVEPIIGKPITVPDSLGHLLRLPEHRLDMPPTLEALSAVLK